MKEELKQWKEPTEIRSDFSVSHTQAGDRWRQRLRRPDGTLSQRTQNPEAERSFWKKRMASGAPQLDIYAGVIYQKLEELARKAGVETVLEIGPGWGNYTLPLCRDFSQVTCVDISPDNLAFLKEETARQQRRLETICAPWETAQVPQRDLVFAYNCFYRMTEPELFLSKINRSAAKLCVIGMNRPPELPWLPDLKEAGLPIFYTCQGAEELGDILSSLGISHKRADIPNRRTYRWKDKEALLQRTEGFLLEPVSRERLWPIIHPYCSQEADGSLCLSYEFFSQLLFWEPTTP